MENELDKAITERIKAGYSKEAIITELINNGYTKESAEAAVLAHGAEIVALPSFGEQLKASFAYVKSRLDVVALLAAVSLPLTVYMLVVGEDIENASSLEQVWFAIILLFTLLLGPVTNAMATYITLNKDTALSLSSAWSYVWGHIGSLLWLWTLVPLAILGGMVLFIVPGIIVSVYLSLALFVFLKEDKRGLAALLRSHALVRGSWWTILGRTFGVMLLAGIAAGLLGIFGPIGEVAGTIVQAAGMFMMLYVVADCYRVFASNNPECVAEANVSTIYKLLIGLGVFIVVSLGVVLGIGATIVLSGFAP